MSLSQIIESLQRSTRVFLAGAGIALLGTGCNSLSEVPPPAPTPAAVAASETGAAGKKKEDHCPPYVQVHSPGSLGVDSGTSLLELMITISEYSLQPGERKLVRVNLSDNVAQIQEGDDSSHDNCSISNFLSSASGLGRMEIYENNVLINTLKLDGSFKFLKLEVGRQEGTYRYHFVVYDKAGNSTKTEPIALAVKGGMWFKPELLEKDKESPIIDEFEAGWENKSLSAVVRDDVAIYQVRLYEDGKLIRDSKTEIYLSKSRWLEVEGLSGSHTYRLEAEDLAGHVTVAEKKIDFDDKEKPKITSFSGNPYTGNVSAVVEDNRGISEIRLYEDGRVIHSVNPSLDNLEHSSSEFFSVKGLHGSHVYRIEAVDLENNVSSVTARFNLTFSPR